MTKLSKVTLALAACLLATGALGQNGFTQETENVTVPEELFGSGTTVDLDFGVTNFGDPGFQPRVKLRYAGPSLAAATEFDVTFELQGGAKFSERVGIGSLMWGFERANLGDDGTTGGTEDDEDNLKELRFYPAGRTDTRITYEKTDGGTSGDDSVTFTFEVGAAEVVSAAIEKNTDGDYGDGSEAGQLKIVFELADIKASGLVDAEDDKQDKRVKVKSMVTQDTSGGTALVTIVNGGHCGETEVSDKSDAHVACDVVSAQRIVSGISIRPGGGLISLDPKDDRMVLVWNRGGTGVPLDPQRVSIGTITVGVNALASTVYDEDGDAIDADDIFSDSLDANLSIMVESDSFNDGDVVYIDANSNKIADTRERFAMGETMAEDAVEMSTAPLTVYYVPSGKHRMRHGTEFTVKATTEFADTKNKNTPAKPATAMLNLFGVDQPPVKAYAIAPLSSADVSNVRVTCETSAKSGCHVFFDCRDAMGESLFSDDGVVVGPDMTVRWSQSDISMALGMMEGDAWEGRLACNLLSTAPISAQVLTRANGVLVNNTYVGTAD